MIVSAVTPRGNFSNYLLMARKDAVGNGKISVAVFSDIDIGWCPSICCVFQNVNCPGLIREISGISSGIEN
jgi:hypothetical protein